MYPMETARNTTTSTNVAMNVRSQPLSSAVRGMLPGYPFIICTPLLPFCWACACTGGLAVVIVFTVDVDTDAIFSLSIIIPSLQLFAEQHAQSICRNRKWREKTLHWLNHAPMIKFQFYVCDWTEYNHCWKQPKWYNQRRCSKIICVCSEFANTVKLLHMCVHYFFSLQILSWIGNYLFFISLLSERLSLFVAVVVVVVDGEIGARYAYFDVAMFNSISFWNWNFFYSYSNLAHTRNGLIHEKSQLFTRLTWQWYIFDVSNLTNWKWKQKMD